MTSVLVTGSTGFIGGYVVEALLNKGYSVIATARSASHASDKPWINKVQFIPFDFLDFRDDVDYYQFFMRPDAMIHLAWEGLPRYKDSFHLSENLPRHLLFLENMIRHGLQDLTVTGTCMEYGMREAECREDMDCNPDIPYPKAKYELYKALNVLCRDKNIAFRWIRLFYMYGKGQNPNSLFSQLEKALAEGASVFNMSPGDQERDFLPVEKVAEYIVAIAVQKNIQGIVNCCSGKPVSVKKFVEDHVRASGKKIKLNPGFYPYSDIEPMSFWGNTDKLKQVINSGL